MSFKDTKNTQPNSTSSRTKIRKWLVRVIGIFVLIAAGIYLGPKMLYSFSHESTDDAYLEGTIVPIAAEVKGKVVKVFVKSNKIVEKGNPLLEIFNEDYSNLVKEKKENRSFLVAQGKEIQASIEERKRGLLRAQAELEAASAEARLARKDIERYEELNKKGAISQIEYDKAESQWAVAKARLDAARAGVAEVKATIKALAARYASQQAKIKEAEASLSAAQLDLQRTVVVAPITGRIAQKNVDPGKYVQIGQPLLAIVDEDNIWVTANFKETQIKDMKIGQRVDIKVDSYPGVTFPGHVDSFQPGTGSVFSLLPPQNATGTFVKVVPRIPVKIVLDSPPDQSRPLWPGMSVIPSVNIAEKATKGLMVSMSDEKN